MHWLIGHRRLPWFLGLAFGAPIPVVTMGVHLRAAGMTLCLESIVAAFSEMPIHFFFATQPAAFAFLFGLTARTLRKHQQRIEDLMQQLQQLASHDSLTGLLNRRSFRNTLASGISRAERGQDEAVLMMFDIDHFKDFNDQHGHVAGDALLVQLALRIQERLRPYDCAYRYGGEEFAVVTNTDFETASAMAERIRRGIAATSFQLPQGKEVYATVSIGVACHSDGQSVDQWVQRADAELYLAKESGRNRVCVDRSGWIATSEAEAPAETRLLP